jgi:hypothetical protein
MSTDLQPLPTLPLGVYRHYKGGQYEVVGVARHSESLEPVVMYRPLYNATGMWVRPLAMFGEMVQLADGRQAPRFELIAPRLERHAALEAEGAPVTWSEP